MKVRPDEFCRNIDHQPSFHDYHHEIFNANYGLLGILDWSTTELGASIVCGSLINPPQSMAPTDIDPKR